MTSAIPPVTDSRQRWPWRRTVVAVAATVALALAIGIPTGVLPTPLYTRMTPVQWWNYPIWALTAILGGLMTATYIRRPADTRTSSGIGSASGGGLLAAFAVGCPVCNKLIVATIGMSGALTIWAPLQPIIGVGTVLLLAWALHRRLTTELTCPVPRSAP